MHWKFSSHAFIDSLVAMSQSVAFASWKACVPLWPYELCWLRCIRSPWLFSNNFYLVLKCCILVKNETCTIFSQLVDVYRCIEAPIIHQRRANCKINWSISSCKRKCGFMLKSDIKRCPSATDPFFPGLMRPCP